MTPDFATATIIKRAVQSILGKADGVVRVEIVLGEVGPEVRVVVVKEKMKHYRLMLPVEKRGIPIHVVLSR